MREASTRIANRAFISLYLSLLLLAPGFAGAPKAGFPLVTAGRPAAVIVIPAGAGSVEKRAAEILRESVLRMTGAALPIREQARPGRRGEVQIGFAKDMLPRALAASLPPLKVDGFVAVATRRNLYIVSGGGRGSVYAVVHLLEKYCGCRVFAPGAGKFPACNSIAFPVVREVDAPVNAFRAVNGDFVRNPEYRDWMRLHQTGEVFADGFYVHTFGRLVPPEVHFAGHPEYFALVNGKRIGDQVCPSRPEVFDLMAAALEKEMAAQPEKKIWSVSQNDNSTFCQCPDCLKAIAEEGSPAGPILRLVNRLAARFPDKILSTLAYQYSRPAPQKTKPAPNVQIMLCTIELNRGLPIAEDPSSASFVKDIEAWRRLTPNLYLWDYGVNFSHLVSPFPNLHVLRPNIRFFVQNGALWHFQQANASAGHEFSELKGYLLARLLWNPETDVEAATNEFLSGYYGAASPFLKQYIVALREALVLTRAGLDIYEPPALHAADYLAADRVALYNRLFDMAERAAASDREVLTRVRTARLPVQYAMLEIAKNNLFGPRGVYAEKNGRFVLRPEMKELLDKFALACAAGGVRSLNESGLTPRAYTDAFLRFIDVRVEDDLAFRKPAQAIPPPSPKYARGDQALLTDGVRGAGDYKVHWLGWEGVDFDIVLDLGAPAAVGQVSLGTLYDPRSWILHPRRVAAFLSADGIEYKEIGTLTIDGDQRLEERTRTLSFKADARGVRFVKVHVEGTKTLPLWHPSTGGLSWVFVDEIIVKGVRS